MRRRRHYATTGNRAFLERHRSRPPAMPRSSRAIRLPARPLTPAARAADHGRHRAGQGRRGRPRHRGGRLGADRAARHLRRAGLLETMRPYGAAELGARVRLVYEGAEYRGRARTTTWDGSLSIDGNRIVRAAVINNWNLDRGIQSQDADRLTLEGGDDRQLRRPSICGWRRPDAGRLRFQDGARVGRGRDRGTGRRAARVRGRRPGARHQVAAAARGHGATGAMAAAAQGSRCAPTATPASTSAYSRRTATACGRARSICFAEAARTRAGRQADRTGAQWATVRRD